jgi:hypothetical protein
MPRIGTIWPHSVAVSALYSAKVSRGEAVGGQLGEHPIGIVLDAGGREAAILAISEEAARQLVRDLVAVLGPEPVSPGPGEKPTVSPGPGEKPAEVKPARPEPGPERPRRP